jgi:hypothetical protein
LNPYQCEKDKEPNVGFTVYRLSTAVAVLMATATAFPHLAMASKIIGNG